MNPAIERLRGVVQRLVETARAEGIEPDGPLGQWLQGQVQALEGLAGVLDGQTSQMDTVMSRIEATSKAGLDQVKFLSHAAELTLLQIRTLKAGLIVEHENVTLRMIKEVFPLFAEKLQGALVIREREWNRRVERRRFALAGATVLALAIFLAGVAFQIWSDSDRINAFDDCLSHSFIWNGHAYCAIPGWEQEVPRATNR